MNTPSQSTHDWSIFSATCPAAGRPHARRGVVAPLVAILLPVLLLLCGICINFAWIELNRTELRVATDAAARAAGRAFSEYQDVDEAIDYAVSTAALNNVGRNPLRIDPSVNAGEIEFGLAARANNGRGRYEFEPKNRNAVRNRTDKANSVRVNGKRTADSIGGTIQMIFAGWGPFDQFAPSVASASTQVDRDIALVLDRSGSMLEYKDYPELEAGTHRLRSQNRINNSQRDAALTSIWARAYPYSTSTKSGTTYDKFYFFHSDDTYDEELWEYAYDYERRKGSGSTPAYNTTSAAPRHSRWHEVEQAVDAFLDVLDGTDQEERVSLVTFNSSASVVRSITSNYNNIRNEVIGTAPKDGTNIQDGMRLGADSILDNSRWPNARYFAAKTIVIMSDGDQTTGSMTPSQRATLIVNNYNVIIHTITFSTNISSAGRAEMREVARLGGGNYYHADTGDDLVAIFREIANNLPTLITQ